MTAVYCVKNDTGILWKRLTFFLISSKIYLVYGYNQLESLRYAYDSIC